MSTMVPREIDVFNSVGGAAFFVRLQQEWRERGARVTAFEAITDDEYRQPHGPWGKAKLRWRMYVQQAFLCWKRARIHADSARIRVVTTNPFFAPAWVAWSSRRAGYTINLQFDHYPEALVAAGTLRANSWGARRLAAITRASFRDCAATVFLGEHLRRYAETNHGPARCGTVIPVGADGRPFRDKAPVPLASGHRPVVLYAGQMGRMHDVSTLAGLPEDAMAGVQWRFHSSGHGYAELRRRLSMRSGVVWGEALPAGSWTDTMSGAQIALVTVAPGAEQVVMPSKTYSALVAGQAILAICRRQSDLADLVIRHDCGWVIEPGDTAGLRELVRVIARNPSEVLAKRKCAYAAGHLYYDMDPIASQWWSLFDRLQLGKEITRDDRAMLVP